MIVCIWHRRRHVQPRGSAHLQCARGNILCFCPAHSSASGPRDQYRPGPAAGPRCAPCSHGLSVSRARRLRPRTGRAERGRSCAPRQGGLGSLRLRKQLARTCWSAESHPSCEPGRRSSSSPSILQPIPPPSRPSRSTSDPKLRFMAGPFLCFGDIQETPCGNPRHIGDRITKGALAARASFVARPAFFREATFITGGCLLT